MDDKRASTLEATSALQKSLDENNKQATARLLRNLLIISLVTTTGAAALTVIGGFGLDLLLPILSILVFQIISLLLLWRGQLLPAQVLLPTSLFVAITIIVAFPPGYGLHDINLIVYSVVLILAGLTLGQRGMFIFAGLIIVAIFGIGFGEMNGLLVSPTSGLTSIISPFNLALVVLAIAFIQRALINLLNDSVKRAQASEKEVAERNAELQAFSEGLEKLVKDRTTELDLARLISDRRARQFEAIAQVTRAISSTRDLDGMLIQIPDVINREFGFYHIGIFLLDAAREYAVLSASNSLGGRRMLENGHRLKVGETGIVGYVTATGRPRIALDTGADAVFFNNPDLPDTRSELALPLLFGDAVIGALDVQSEYPNAFDQEDIRILGTLADQVSIAIQNARQYEETRKALAESDALSRQFVQAGWSRFVKTRKIEGIRHTGAKSTLLYKKPSARGTSHLTEVNTLRPRGRASVLSLPVKLRGEVIGSVDVRSPENRRWSNDELDIVNAIIDRAALAMENARLLEDSQKLAAKERTIGEISAKISAQSEVDDLLKIAAQELGRSLPGMEIAIQLTKDRESGHV
jgi:GAF domain-containing protein